FREDRDSSSFVCSHQRWFLQQLRQVAVDGGVPPDNALQRQPIHLRTVGGAAEVVPALRPATLGPGRVIRMHIQERCPTGSGVVGLTIERQSEQAIDLRAPRIQLACWMSVRVENAGCSPYAL